MTVQEIHIRITQDLQNQSGFAYADMLPEELDLAFNDQTDEFINMIFSKKFDDKQLSTDFLKNIIIDNFEIQSTLRYENVYQSTLPSDYRNLINVRVKNSKACGKEDVEKITKAIMYDKEIVDDVNEMSLGASKFNATNGALFGNNIVTYTDGSFKTVSVFIDYVKIPREIDYNNNITSELSDIAIKEIIKMVVIKIAKITEQNQNKIQFLQQDLIKQ